MGTPRDGDGTPRSTRTGVWSVSHQNLTSLAAAPPLASKVPAAADVSSVELVTDVSFVWNEPANSCFLTGTFNHWESTVPMEKLDGGVWVAVKALPPGEYQYKFIVDNVWRHAPDQTVVYDERGIINNHLTVKIESCGDVTCFCYRIAAATNLASPSSTGALTSQQAASSRMAGKMSPQPGAFVRTVMTPRTERHMANSTGVAVNYIEKDVHDGRNNTQRSIMHTLINDRPFEVSVVNVGNLRTRSAVEETNPDLADGMMSRVSSWEELPALKSENKPPALLDAQRSRYAPQGMAWNEDAAYAAALRNHEESSLPRTAAGRATMLQSDPTELAFSVRARFSSPLLGFDPKETHEGILLTEAYHCATRVQERGLYKTARGAKRIPVGRDVYMEIYIHKSSNSGGVCFGLSTRELPLSCLVGARPNSIGWSTSGNLLRTIDGKETWARLGSDAGSGCTIGMLVHLDDGLGNADNPDDPGNGNGDDMSAQTPPPIALPQRQDSDGSGDSPSCRPMVRRRVRVEYFVDGKSIGSVEDFTFLGNYMDVFPTLSLFARNAKVYALFNAEDMLHAPALPEDRPIYTVDGNQVVRDSENTPQSLGVDQ